VIVAKKPASSGKPPARGAKAKLADAPSLVPAAPALRPVVAPVGLGSILGQDHPLSILRRSLGSGRLHHAWIFHGPAGVGKFTTAHAFAAMILDPTLAERSAGVFEVDPTSSTQRLLTAGTHPDLHFVTKELALVSRDAQIRDSKQRTIAKEVLEEFLIEPATRTASASTQGEPARAAKVFLVDEAELIDARGQNALLKTLEEPAPGRVIVLITSREERLLPTIRSRCQRVGFQALDDATMKLWLRRAIVAGRIAEPDPASLPPLLAFADGSPGLMRLALTTSLKMWPAELGPRLAEFGRGKYPTDLGATMAKLIDDWATAWVEAPENENASKDAASKAAARYLFRYLGQHYRGALRSRPDERALDAIDLISSAERQVEANVQAVFVLENLAAQIALAAAGARA
jgi:DNA polymerase III subunit delta'